MSAVAMLGGAALLVGAYAFHWRARLLGSTSRGWPVAPRLVRWAMDAVAFILLIAGLYQILTGKPVPLWMNALAHLILAAYAVVLAFNISRQRATSA